MNNLKGKHPTLGIIKTTIWYKFGDYTFQMWKEGEIKYNNAFVFSLYNKKNIILNNQNMVLVLKKMKDGNLVVQIMQLLRIVIKIIVMFLEMLKFFLLNIRNN